jgi:hypothetical protein
VQNVMQKELMPGLLACAVTSCCRFSPVLMSNPTSPLQPLRRSGDAGGLARGRVEHPLRSFPEVWVLCMLSRLPPSHPHPILNPPPPSPYPASTWLGPIPPSSLRAPQRSTEIHGDRPRRSTEITTETHGNHEASACVAYALRLAHTPPERIRHAQATLRRGGSPRHQGGCRCLG